MAVTSPFRAVLSSILPDWMEEGKAGEVLRQVNSENSHVYFCFSTSPKGEGEETADLAMAFLGQDAFHSKG